MPNQPTPNPHTLDSAIMRTVLYGDVFHFPMTPGEIHHYLIHHEAVSLEQVCTRLMTSPYLNVHLTQRDGYVALQHKDDVIATRIQRQHASEHLLPKARAWARRLARVPFVRMVALTGALAMHNPRDVNDDLDYIIVMKPGRVWLGRALVIGLVYVGRVRGVEVCPNYVVAHDALVQTRRDIYIAHEVAQMVPYFGYEVYAAMRDCNRWVLDQLPNATGAYHTTPDYPVRGLWRWLKGAGEWLLGGRLGDRLDRWEQGRKQRRFAERHTTHSAAKLDGSQVKGHFDDHGQRVINAYHERLAEYGLTDVPLRESAAD